MIKTNTTPQELWDKLKKADNPICCIDSRMDLDAFSSALAVSYVLKRDFGKPIRLTYLDKISPEFTKTLTEIVGPYVIEEEKDPSQIDFSQHDAVLVLDCGNENHVSKNKEFAFPLHLLKINIDHHFDANPGYGTLNYIMRAGSTCTVLLNLFEELGIPLDKTLGQLLLTGVLTDTQFFSLESTTPFDLSSTATLLEVTGEKYIDYLEKFAYREPAEKTIFKKLAYENLVLDTKNGIAHSTVTLKQLTDAGLDPKTDLNKFDYQPADEFRRIDGIQIAIFIKENYKIPNAYGVSLRSKTTAHDVSKIAQKFGGGGHVCASGCMLTNMTSISEALDQILAECKGIS